VSLSDLPDGIFQFILNVILLWLIHRLTLRVERLEQTRSGRRGTPLEMAENENETKKWEKDKDPRERS